MATKLLEYLLSLACNYRVLLCLLLLLAVNRQLSAQDPITTINVTGVAGTTSADTTYAPSDAINDINPSSIYYVKNGQGTNRNIQVTSFIVSSTTYDNFLTPDTVAIRRTDGSRFINIWYELISDPQLTQPDLELGPDAVVDADAVYLTRNLNAGYDNILVNNDDEGLGAIQAQTERVDIIWRTGIVTCAPQNAIFPVIDRGGNDEVKVAAITSLDANGNPDGYSNMILIQDSDWPGTGQSFDNFLILRRQTLGEAPIPIANIGTYVLDAKTSLPQPPQIVQGVAVSFDDLSIASGQVVYGYSIFASDVDPNVHDLTDITTFPNTTLASNSGLDLVAGITAAVSSDDCLTPATGPGGYKKTLSTWLKANGVDRTGNNEVTSSASQGASVTDWQDHWIGNNDFSTDQGTPTYNLTSSLINFNPSVEFASASLALTVDPDEDFNDAASYAKKGINIVIRTPSTLSGKQVIYEQGDGDRGINIHTNGSTLYVTAWNQIADGAGAPWNTGNPVNTISVSGLETDTEYIISFELDGNNTITGTARAYLNGEQFGTLSGVGLLYDHSSGDVTLGSSDATESLEYNDGQTSGTAFSFEGEIPEFIYCNLPSSGSFLLSQRRRIESYLAIKYGITLDQTSPINYVNSDGSVIYNTTLSTALGGYITYNKDIAGIGRDDASELSQLQSRSENTGSVITMARSTDFPNDNTFLIWGNDAGADTDTETSDVPSIINRRVEKVWRVAETNSSGLVSVTFDLDELTISGSPGEDEYSLLIAGNSSNGVFTSAQIITGGVLDVGNNTITFNNVDFSNGQFFTLGTGFISCAPGGVTTDLAFWLKADLGTNTQTDGADVLTWADQAGSNDASEVDAGGTFPEPIEPAYNSNSINFNPSITYIDVPALLSNSYMKTSSLSTAGDMSIIALFSTTDTQAGSNYYYSPMFVSSDDGVIEGTFAFGHANGQIITNFSNDDQIDAQSTGNYNDGIAHIALTTRQASTSSSAIQIYVDGENDGSGSSVTDDLDLGTEGLGIGNTAIVLNDTNGNGQYEGDMAEVIMFNDVLTSTERQQVESYLAIKYGITLDQTSAYDYLNSSGSTIWNATTNSTYNSNIAGIGRDDASCLQQKQSKSVENTSIVTMGLGTIEESNAENLNTFSVDNSFLIWGSDGSDPNDTPITTQLPGSVTQRMDPIWRVQETGTVGDVSISFDLTGLTNFTSRSASQYQLIIASSGSTMPDLSGASTYSGGTFDGNVLTFNNVDFSDGDYFTLGTATETCAPGGVSTNLELWLRADDGTNGTTDGSTVSSWTDQSANGFNASAANLGGLSPVNLTYEIDEINFNPAVRFYDPNSTNAVFMETSGSHSVTGDMSVVVAFKSGQYQGVSNDFYQSPVFVSTGSNSVNTDYGLGMFNGRLHVNADNNNTFNAQSPSSPLYNTLEPIIATFTRVQAASGAIELYANSANIASGTSSNTALNASTTWGIGNHPGANSATQVPAQLSGRLGEVIVFSGELSATERQQVESYLAIKYGITRSVSALSAGEQDYLASDGTTHFFDWDENTTYRSDIAGVGRDDGSCLTQTKSKSENNDAIVTMEVNAFGTDNSFLMWANDNASIEDPDNREYNKAQVQSRLNREWRVQETGTVGTTSITFDLANVTGPTGIGTNNLNQVVMMVDADGDFTSGVTLIEATSIDAVKKTVTFSYNFTDGQFFTLGSPEEASLPIELLSFSATELQNEIYLSWTTASEDNNSYFSIERSENGEVFNSIAEIDGAGNSNTIRKYRYTDKTPLDGRSYYRLKQVDFNGDFSYSPVESVLIVAKEEYSLSVSPNPVSKNEALRVEYSLPKSLKYGNLSTVSIYDIRGKLYLKEILKEEDNSFITTVSDYAEGIYLVVLEASDGTKLTKRLIIRQ